MPGAHPTLRQAGNECRHPCARSGLLPGATCSSCRLSCPEPSGVPSCLPPRPQLGSARAAPYPRPRPPQAGLQLLDCILHFHPLGPWHVGGSPPPVSSEQAALPEDQPFERGLRSNLEVLPIAWLAAKRRGQLCPDPRGEDSRCGKMASLGRGRRLFHHWASASSSAGCRGWRPPSCSAGPALGL